MKLVAPADLMFLLLETRNSPMHVAGLNIYSPPADAAPTFVADLVTRWKRFPEARAPFNQRVVLHLGAWFWEDADDFDLDCHIQHLALPGPGRMSDLLDLVARLHGQLLDRQRPLWEAYIIEGLPEGRFATYMKIHHALIDGVSGAKMMAQSLSTDPGEHKAPIWAYRFPGQALPIRHAPRGLAARLARQVGAAVQDSRQIVPGMLAGVWDILRRADKDSGEVLPLQAPPTPLNEAISSQRGFAAQPISLERLQRLGHACGATVNDIALAICAGALRQYLLIHHSLPRQALVAMVPVSLHEPGAAEGNQISLLLASLATSIADPHQRLQAIVQSTRTAKQRLQKKSRLEKWAYIAPMFALAAPLMFSGDARRHPLFNVIISNVPGPRETLYLCGARLEEVYPVSIPADYLSLNITFTSYGDNLGFGFIACRRAMPAIQEMPRLLCEALIELEQALLGGTSAKRKSPRKAPANRSAGQKKGDP